jgi:hypothetical protein
MSKRHDADLMAFADGELEQRASRELEDALARDATSRAKVDAIGELGDLLRGHVELSADALPQNKLDALWREIDKGIDREKSGAAQSAKASQSEEVGVVRKIGRWFDRYRGHILTGAVSAGAVAALALLLRNPTPESSPQGIAQGGGSGSGSGSAAIQPTLVTHEPAEIQSLDTPDGTGTVFNLEDEDGTTTVIWVTPDDTVEGI